MSIGFHSFFRFHSFFIWFVICKSPANRVTRSVTEPGREGTVQLPNGIECQWSRLSTEQSKLLLGDFVTFKWFWISMTRPLSIWNQFLILEWFHSRIFMFLVGYSNEVEQYPHCQCLASLTELIRNHRGLTFFRRPTYIELVRKEKKRHCIITHLRDSSLNRTSRESINHSIWNSYRHVFSSYRHRINCV